MTTIRLAFICFLLMNGLLSFGQTGELDHIDCLYSKEVVVPFNVTDSGQPFVPVLDQTVFYSYRDQFSYWYKIKVRQNTDLAFKVAPINDSDDYAVYVYQYNADDFCKNVFEQKAKPVKASFFKSYIPGTFDPLDLRQRVFAATKNNTYYICVLNVSPNNCGHTLQLVDATDTLNVKAIHLPCRRSLSALAVNIPVKKAELKTDSLPLPQAVPVTVKEAEHAHEDTGSRERTETFLLTDSQKKSPVNGKLVVTDPATGEEIATDYSNKGTYKMALDPAKSYRVRASAFGYKSVDQTYGPGTNETALPNPLEIVMTPLKEGDNFIMRSIYFYPNTYALKQESSEELQKLLTFLSEHPTVSIEIQGHTNGDNRIFKNKAYAGLGEEWNFQGSAKKLSQMRAEAIKNYLVTNGIATERLTAKGLGGEKPIIKDPETNEEGQRNIRVEMVILSN